MLQGFSRSLPFLLIRIVLVLLEGATLYYGSIFIHDWFLEFMSGHVDGLFLIMLSFMGWIIGLGASAIIVKYIFGVVQYYFKLAHIVYLTMLTLEYKPYNSSRFVHALSEATSNFGSLALNDFTTRGVVKALGALKDAILNTDLMSRFKDPQTSIVKFVKAICTTGLTNVINMTDEIIVSYTWFTNDLYMADRKRRNLSPPNMKDKVKNKALFMLEGVVFTVRVLPQLMLNSLLFEVAFLILANVVTITAIIVLAGYVGFSFAYIVWAIILYRTLIHIFYYVIIQSLRLNVYLYSFYAELNELEPFNITEMLADLLGKVPLLGGLVKMSGQRIEPTGSEGSPILEGDLNAILRENVNQVASAFNLNTAELLQEDINNPPSNIPDNTPEPDNQEEEVLEEVADTTVNPVENPVAEEIPIETEDIEIEVGTSSSPFDNSNRVNNQRR